MVALQGVVPDGSVGVSMAARGGDSGAYGRWKGAALEFDSARRLRRSVRLVWGHSGMMTEAPIEVPSGCSFSTFNGTGKSHQQISDTEGGSTGILDDGDWFGFSVA